MAFAVVIISDEVSAPSQDETSKFIKTEKGDEFIVTKCDGWIEATSAKYHEVRYKRDATPIIPDDVMTFRTQAAAEKFAKRWPGHPWWVKPSGEYRVIEVKRRRAAVGWAEKPKS